MPKFFTTPAGILVCWMILINLSAFLVFGLDKWKARRGAWRVPERTLFTLAWIGGSVGALLGMRVFHHKTLHKRFRFGIPLILLAQIAVAAGLYLFFHLPK